MNLAMTQGVHHLGLTVSKLEDSASFFTTILGWTEIKCNVAFPAIYVSDGHIMLSLWQLKNDVPVHFDRHANIGLHHVAFMLDKENDLHIMHDKLLQHAIEIEFSPELLGQGPARHLMCIEPSGIRVEFIWPGNS